MAATLVGARIRHFQVVRQLGQGGMGEVYVGHDEKLGRKVALKTIRAEHRLDDLSRARFLREARVLSQLAHPGICQIHDLIETDEADVLVLELIQGKTLRAALKEGLDHRARLRVARELAEVLVAAHAKGVVHRDLKPDNVMLTEAGQTKVLDFGLSRHLGEEGVAGPAEPERATTPAEPPAATPGEHTMTLGGATGPTAAGPAAPTEASGEGETVFLGSSPSAAPASGSASARGAAGVSRAGTVSGFEGTVALPSAPGASGGRESASDSLHLTQVGTILGTLGYMSPEQAAGEEVTAASDIYSLGLMFQELFTGESPYEDARASTMVEKLERARRGETRPVRGLDADLTALVERMKTVDHVLRPTAVEVVDRLRDVEEKPRRRRRQRLIAAAIGVLVLFSVGATVQAFRIAREKRRADEQTRAATNALDYLSGMFDVANPRSGRGTTVTAEEILDHGRSRVEGLGDQPLLQASVMQNLGRLYRELGLYDKAQPLLERSLAVRERSLGPTHLEVATNLTDLALLALDQGKYALSESLHRRALEIREQALGPRHAEVAVSVANLAALYYHERKYAQAEPLSRRALEIREEARGKDHPEVATSLNVMANLYATQGKHAEAEPLYRRALAIRERAFGGQNQDVAETANALAILYSLQGRFREAQPLYERALGIREKVFGARHPATAESLNNLAIHYVDLADFARAEALHRRALETREAVFGPEHPTVAESVQNLAVACKNQAKHEEAEALLRRALEMHRRARGPEHPLVGECLANLADLAAKRGRPAEAESLAEEALALFAKAYAPDHPVFRVVHQFLAGVSARQGKKEQALEHVAACLRLGVEAGTLASDADLGPLRGEAGFQALLAGARDAGGAEGARR